MDNKKISIFDSLNFESSELSTNLSKVLNIQNPDDKDKNQIILRTVVNLKEDKKKYSTMKERISNVINNKQTDNTKKYSIMQILKNFNKK